MKRVKHFINTIVWALVGLYVVVVVMVNIPMAQSFIAHRLAQALSSKLGTPVSVGRVDVGLFNRLIVDDVSLVDQKGVPFFKATRLSVKVDYLEAMYGRVAITSAQVFGMKARLYRANADSPLNIQYVIDSLASKDTTAHKPLDLQISSLIIRHGEMSYDQLNVPRKATLDVHHLHVRDLSSHIILNALRDDSLNLNVKKIAFNERSGFRLKSLSFKVVANTRHAHLEDFKLLMPQSQLLTDGITANYRVRNKQLESGSLHFDGKINTSYISPRDMAFLDKALGRYATPLVFSIAFTGTSNSLNIHRLDAIIAHEAHAKLLTAPADASLSAHGSVLSWSTKPRWNAVVERFAVNNNLLSLLSSRLPAFVPRLGDVSYRGKASGVGRDVKAQGTLHTSEGDANLAFAMVDNKFKGHLETDGVNVGKILDDARLGLLAANLDVTGDLPHKRYVAKGHIGRFDWNQYKYQGLTLDATYDQGQAEGKVAIDDPNVAAVVQGFWNGSKSCPSGNLTAVVTKVNPTALHFAGNSQAGAVYGGRVAADFSGRSLSTLAGNLKVNDFYVTKADEEYRLDNLELALGSNASERFLTFDSDFGHGEVRGKFDYASLLQNLENLVVAQLPSLQKFTPLRHRPVRSDNVTLQASITRGDWLRHLLGLPIEINAPIDLNATLSSQSRYVDLQLNAPDIVYGNRHLRQVNVSVTSPNENLCAEVKAIQMGSNGIGTDLQVNATAEQDELSTEIRLDNHARRHRLKGRLLSMIQFGKNDYGVTEARFNMRQSELSIGDTLFTIHPASVVYSKNHLEVNDLAVSSGHQYVKVAGVASKGSDDSITVDLKDVNVEYVLDLVGFHSVEFSGFASGQAYVTHLFDGAGGHADLRVNRFQFEDGNMGTLMAKVGWNPEEEQIDIDAQAVDTLGGLWVTDTRLTTIRGYVSPKRNYIDLDILAKDTRGDFVQSFCSSFMGDADITINGDLRLWGDLKKINLTGDAVARGTMHIKPLNTTYELQNDTIHFLVNEIRFSGDTLRDRNGNVGVFNGSLYHQHLSRLTYDFDVQLHHLLGYDWDGSDGSAFYGTVYASGDVHLKGRSGEVIIDINATPEKGSQVVYNVSNPDAIASREFIHWASRDTMSLASDHLHLDPTSNDDDDDYDMPTNIHINFLINTTADATLKVIMDNTSGDYISLNGSGVIRAFYYNKGGLDVYGNYLIDHGVYKLTIQNIIKRDFDFLQGGLIAFGGDPYQADLNLKAQYQLNSVSLSDLQLGRSFSGNNIRVNCLMNITGTPASPKVDFSMDLPTVGTDAKQMIYSIINSEEEMNQQVLYLLAVGRFLSPGSNNAMGANNGEKQTSLAMQSILSGQLSQQINNVLSTVINDNNWNFGANISTGDEGWNNAEYEGLLSGRMLNNRLLINGQFGYRDNVNATTSFIGDFDIRYLIMPNGNLSVRVYNQTNDRYFTRNSLNTQGIGFILKRDFNGWRDLLGINRKKKGGLKTSKSVKKP